jgi:hypothetical protein
VLEQARRPRPEPAAESDASPAPAEAEAEGRGVTPPSTSPGGRTAKRDKKVKGRTIYLHDDLWERLIVQAHRKDLTISEYVADRLDKVVPNHRKVAVDPANVPDHRVPDPGPSIALADPADDQEAA